MRKKWVKGKPSLDVIVQSKEMSDGFPSDEPVRGSNMRNQGNGTYTSPVNNGRLKVES